MMVCFFVGWLLRLIEHGGAGASPLHAAKVARRVGPGWGIARGPVPTGRGGHFCHTLRRPPVMRIRDGVGGGRGNLRENREDPAPTVGRLRGFHCASNRAQRPPIDATMRVPCHPTCLPPMEPLWFLQRRGTPRRYGLRDM